MEIPNLPTDNLYKFTFMSGLFLIVMGVTVFVSQYKGILEKLDTTEAMTIRYGAEIKLLRSDMDRNNQESDRFDKNYKIKTTGELDTLDVATDLSTLRKNLKDKNFRDYYAFLITYRKELTPYIEKLNKMNSNYEKVDSLNRQLTLKEANIAANFDSLKYQRKTLWSIAIFSLLCFVAGLLICKWSYKKWETLVQIPLDEKLKLEIELLKSSIKDNKIKEEPNSQKS